MRSRKLYHLLILFREQDQNRFSLFLRSPYFNTSPTLTLFWEEWKKKVLRSRGGENLNAAELVAGSNLKISQVDKLSSKLYHKAREFLKVEELETQGLVGDVLLTKAVLNRDPKGDGNHRFVEEIEQAMEARPVSSEKYLALFFHHYLRILPRIGQRSSARGLAGEFQEMFDHLDDFADSKVMQLGCSAINVGQILRQGAPGVVAYLKERLPKRRSEREENLLGQIYRKVLELLQSGTQVETVEEVLDLLESEGEALTAEALLEIYNFVLNQCIRIINQGNMAFLGPALDLHIRFLDMGVLLESGKLPPQQFKNMVGMACRIGRLEWVEKFIAEYGGNLLEDHGGKAYRFNLAILRFHQKRFKEAITMLKEVIQDPGPDVFYGTDSRMYLWKAYYEAAHELSSEEVDEMFRLYDSFRLFIDRHSKISEQHRLQYRNHIRLFKRFLHVVQGNEEDTRAELEELQRELAAISDFPNRTWLVRKVEAALNG